MKKKIIFIFVALLLQFNLMNSQDNLKVLSYNMMGMKPDTDWEIRLYHIIQHIKGLDPDIIGLQEINQTQGGNAGDNMAQTIVDSLESHFGVNYYLYEQITHTSWSQFDESIGIISKYPVIASNYLDLTPGVFPRKVVWNYINTPLGPINFFNTHLSYLENHNNIRMQQVQEIMDFIEAKENTWPTQASILTGDFNCTPGSDPITFLVEESEGSFYYSTFNYANPTSPGYTHPAETPNRKIDFVFLKNNSELGIDTSMVVIGEPYDGVHYPSDHRGIMTIMDESSLHIGEAGPMPSQFQFIRQYPNPFNPATTIEFYLQRASDLKIVVFNILGEQVKEIFLSQKKEGFHQYILDFTGFSTGVYYISVDSGSKWAIQKCVYMK